MKVMLSSEFPCTKFLLIDHPRKLRKFHIAKISGYTVSYAIKKVSIGVTRTFLMLGPRKPNTVCSDSFINCVGGQLIL